MDAGTVGPKDLSKNEKLALKVGFGLIAVGVGLAIVQRRRNALISGVAEVAVLDWIETHGKNGLDVLVVPKSITQAIFKPMTDPNYAFQAFDKVA